MTASDRTTPTDPGRTRRIGVLGGAFNPPHIGHLVLAREAASKLGLERVLLVPTGKAPHKTIADDPGPGVRLELTRLATGGDAMLVAEPLEVEALAERGAASYTYLTLEALAEREKGEIVLLMGGDVAGGLEGWKRPQRIAELATIGVAARGEMGLGEALEAVRAVSESVVVEGVRMPSLGVSSSMIRERVRSDLPIRYLVVDAVAEEIERRGLYAG